MDASSRPSQLKAALATTLFVWFALIAAGRAGEALQPSAAGALLTLGLYAALLILWSRFTSFGRRVRLAGYLGAAVLYLPFCLALFSSVQYPDSPAWLLWATGGLEIGFRETYLNHDVTAVLTRLGLNLLVPILLVVGQRDLRRATV